MTLVAFLCDDVAVQPLLPQVFVSNQHVLSAVDVAQLNSACPSNVFFVRRKSSWVNVAVLLEILELFSALLQHTLRTHRVILHMDASRVHLHASVARACSRAGLFLMYIPASTTAWLQPLDVSVFSQYKAWVRAELERKRLVAPAGVLSRSDIMSAYSDGIRAILEAKGWANAFEVTGLRGQSNLSTDLMSRLRWATPQAVPSSVPSLADFQAIYPRGARVPFDELFELVLRCSRPVQLLLPQRARLPRALRAPSLP